MATDYRKAAGEKAAAAGLQNSIIKQHGKKYDCEEYLLNGTWAVIWGEPKRTIKKDDPDVRFKTQEPATEVLTNENDLIDDLPVKESLPVVSGMGNVAPVKAPLPAMKFSIFHHKKHSKAMPLILNNSDKFITMLAKHDIRQKKDGKLFAPVAFNGSRSNNNFVSASGICIDCDHGQPTIEGVLAVFPDALAAFYTTHSHTPESPRFRIVLPLSRSVNADEHALLVLGIKSIIPLELMECIDQTCFERARVHYLPSCPPGQEVHAKAGHQKGQPLDVEHFLKLGCSVEIPAAPAKSPSPIKVLPVKAPLPAETAETADTAILKEPANEKKRPSFDNWHTQVYPHEFSNDAWKALKKNGTAIMVLITCRAKHGHAAHDRTKKSTGLPTWSFTVKQAETQFKITRPTFIKAMALIQEIGFIENVRAGNFGSNTPALYRLSEKWKSWKQPESDNTNIMKARSMRLNSAG